MSAVYRGGVWSPLSREQIIEDKPESLRVDVLIPALNEQESIGLVLAQIPADWVRRVIVVNNGSDDDTAKVAKAAGALVVDEPRRGYGQACLSGLELMRQDPPDVVVFLDADYSDHPEELVRHLQPILVDEVDLVIGSRTIGMRAPGALLPQALFGNKLASLLIEGLYGYRFTDLGPFRAIRWDALERIQMEDTNFGWTVEMQVKAAHYGLSAVEVPVSYRQRVGVSKITGTLEGTVRAGYKILYTIFAYYLSINGLSPADAKEAP